MKYQISFLICMFALINAFPQQGQRRQQQGEFQPTESQDNFPQRFQQNDQKNLRTTTYIPIIRFDKEQSADGSYKTAWETGNNIVAEETGFLKDLPTTKDENNKDVENHAQVQHGSYSYTAPDGQIITVSYTADEFGFRPTGDHLPTPPPVSPEVQKGLDLIYAGIKAQQEEAARNPRPQGNFVRE